jgi:hypothetical protein
MIATLIENGRDAVKEMNPASARDERAARERRGLAA